MRENLLSKVKSITFNANMIHNHWSFDSKYMEMNDSSSIEEHCSQKPDSLARKNVTSMCGLITRKHC